MELPLRDDTVSVSLSDCDVTVATPSGRPPVDVRRAATDAVARPHGSRLADRVDSGDTVAIVVTDALDTLLV